MQSLCLPLPDETPKREDPRSRKGGYAVALRFALCLLCCFMSDARWSAERPEADHFVGTATGAPVALTVASDVQLSDYEAYTRGDRFYVRILWQTCITTGSLLGRGFDDCSDSKRPATHPAVL